MTSASWITVNNQLRQLSTDINSTSSSPPIRSISFWSSILGMRARSSVDDDAATASLTRSAALPDFPTSAGRVPAFGA
jgi:hypothetical protein